MNLLAQMRAANERLVVATVRADELAEEAIAARAVVAEIAATEAERRKRAEELAERLMASEDALRASEAQLLTLANTVPMLAWYANPDGSIAWHNERWYEYAGTAFKDTAGWKWVDILDPADQQRVIARWRSSVASGEPWEDVFRLRRHDGALRWFLARALPLRDELGRIERWFGTSVDIDDQKHAEAQALASDHAKDEFLAMLGHELRNPLAPILMTLDLMEMRDPTVFVRERTIIHDQVKHLVRLVDDLLDISRITGGKIELQCEPTELAGIVARAVEMVRPLVEHKAHHLSVDIAEHGLSVDGDPIRLTQAIGNLIANAAKYTPARGSIRVTAQRRGAKIALQVRDTGIGISAEMLPRVFDVFAQEHQALARSEGGLGLGLTIVQRLVEMHGGTVRAASDGVGHGSEFTIELPMSVRPVRAEPTTPARTAPEPLGLKILVVDDNPYAAEPIAEMLNRLFVCEVRIARDGPSALAVAQDFAPDLALLDIGLPGMDGYELASRLSSVRSPHVIRFIAITGYSQPADVRQTRQAGFDQHLVKPVTTATLRDSVLAMASLLPHAG